jgi:hypothetical protein
MDRTNHPSRVHGLRGITAGDGDGYSSPLRRRFGFDHDWRLTMAVDFSKLPIGTKVETAYGPGKIVLGLSPRVTVRVGDVDYQYTPSGKRCEYDKRPTLFVAPFEWPEQEQPLPDLAVDTPVMVRSRGDRSWRRRHFCRWEDGKCVTFTDGFSSWLTKTISRWDEWRLPTNEELKGADNVE